MTDNLLEITDTNFSSAVLTRKEPVLVDFWAPRCGPCRMLGPIIEELADEFAGRMAIGKLNIDDATNSAVKYGIASIPTLLVFKDGQVVDKIVGAMPKTQLHAALMKHL